MTRSEQASTTCPNAVAVLGPEALGFTARKASLDEARRGVPGLTVENRRDYGLTGGIARASARPVRAARRHSRARRHPGRDSADHHRRDHRARQRRPRGGAVRRIEVIRGPSSVLYGNAAGGVISLVTEMDPTRRLTIRPDLQWGSHGYRRQ